MTTHVSERQVRWWLDRNAIQDITAHTQEETEFNLQVTLSSLPIHLIKEETKGPIRVVGRSGLDSERARRLVRDDGQRAELLSQIGPVLATTPGFYTFLDEEGGACELREAETLQMEHRIYPDGASQQALMDSVMAIATAMRYLQNLLTASSPQSPRNRNPPESNPLESEGEGEED
ncbi:hypothetical protein [Halopiger thermotolerans]